jgi:two-component system, NtrC family, nitrogen regulation response regulator GlnG
MAEPQHVESLCLIGRSDAMQQLYKMIGRVCNTDCPILLVGERGSGKKAVARALHFFSHRSSHPFRMITATDAHDATDEQLLSIGDPPHTAEGTCYITELSSMAVFMQHRLLSLYLTGEYKCSHKNRPEKHNFRFIAANDGDIRELLESGRLPIDLFYDWNFLPLYVPPLRDRKEDIPLLANHFLDLLAAEMKTTRKELSPEAMDTMLNYEWPGNLNQLMSVLRTALANGRANYIRSEHLGSLQNANPEESAALQKLELFLSSKLTPYIETSVHSYEEGDLYRLLLPQVEKSVFQFALKKSKGNKNKAANLLGVHRNTLNKKLPK